MDLYQVGKSGNPIYESAILKFEGVGGRDVYNCSIPFTWHGETYLFGRVEKRSVWADSWSCLFRRTGKDLYEKVPESRIYQLEDPYVFFWKDEIVLGGTHVVKEHGEIRTFTSYFYRGSDLMHLDYFTTGADGMKDVRLTRMADGRIGVFSRPRGTEIAKKYGSEAMIGFTAITDLNELGADTINRAEYITGIFENGQWGGCNQAYLLKDGTIGVIGHLSNRIPQGEGKCDLLSYKNISFCFDPAKMCASDIRILATRSDYPDGPAKKPDLTDCAFTSGIERRTDGRVNLYSGIGDCEEGRVVIDNPFGDLLLPSDAE